MSERADTSVPDDPQATIDETADSKSNTQSDSTPLTASKQISKAGDDPLQTTAGANDQTIGPDDDPLMTVDPFASYDPELTAAALATALPDDEASTMGAATEAADFAEMTFEEEEQSQISEWCGKFESAWNQDGKEPSVVEFVPPELDPGLRQSLVRQLVLIDIEYRKKRHASLAPTEYLSQLPDFRDAVASVFAKPKSRLPRQYGSVVIPKSNARSHQNAKPFHADDPTTRYRPTDFLARGGLGCVFHAQDSELKRLVALKEILPDHADNERLQEKFLFEATVTGQLEHPGIVPVYGLGRYQDNQPYYAMRFIRGNSFQNVIQEFHRKHAPLTGSTFFGRDFRALLRRLIDACNAMHYAHVHGVLHRDIKPDNIMIGGFGETLVVDWGLAKLVELKSKSGEDAGNSNLDSLRDSGRFRSDTGVSGTPMYMSPEQASGRNDQLDGRTDIYSLGAVLFYIVSANCAVTGKTARDVITNVRLGKTITVDAVAPAAPKALASICRMAMSLERDDRYQTAVELAEDIERWMSDEMVLAHVGHETITERAGRLIRKHRSWTMSVATSLLVITIVAIVSALLINNAKQNEHVAKQDAVARYRDSREAIDTWLVQSSDALEFFPETQSVRTKLLQLATADYEKLSARPSQDPELELERGRALVKLGDLNQMQQDYETAESHYQSALELFATHTHDDQLSLRFRSEHGNVHTRLGLAYAGQKQTEEAEREFQNAIEELTKLSSDINDPLPLRLLAVAHVNAGELYLRSEKLDLAGKSFEQGLKQYALLGTGKSSQSELNISRTRELLGRVYTRRGEHEKALIQFNDSIDALQRLVAAEPDHPDYLDALASAYVSQANSFRDRGLQNQELEALQSSINSYRALRIALPDVPRYTENLAITLTDIGLALHESGSNKEAEQHLIEAHQLLEELAFSYGKVPRFRIQLATCQDALGQVFVELKEDPSEAVQILTSALSVLQDERLVIAKSHISQALARQGQNELAKQVFETAISELSDLINLQPIGEKIPASSNALAHIHYQYALLLDDQEDAQAEIHFQRARDIWIKLAERQTASYTHQLAWLLATCPTKSVRDIESAPRYAKAAVDLAPENSQFITTLALTNLLAGDADAAIELLERSKTLRGHWIDRDHLVLAMCQQLKGQRDEAQQSRAEGVKWMQANRPYNADLRILREITESKLAKEAK